MATSAELQAVQQGILRKKIVAEADLEAASGTTVAQYTEVLVERAETSTEPVLIMFDNIVGKVPTSAQLDTLAAVAQAQFDYYAKQGVANPEIGPYEALGRSLSSTAGFHAQSDGKSDGQFIVDAYVKAFGTSPGTPQVQHFQAQIDYFKALYIGAGIPAAEAANQARGAVFGQIFGISALVEDSPLDTAAENFLRGTVTGTAIYDAPLSASQPTGPDPDVQTVDLTPNTDAGVAFSLGVGDDTFNAQVQQTAFAPIQTLNNTDNLDGGEGRDTLNVQLVQSVVPAGLKSIEVVNIDGAPGFFTPPVTLDVVNANSIDTIGFRAPTNNVTVTNLKTVLATVNISDQKGGLTDTINFVRPSGQVGLSGANDELAINLTNIGQGAGAVALVLNQLTAGGGGYETLDVNSTGGIPNDFNVRGTAQTAATVNITGDTDLNINSPQADAWNVGTLHTLDASTFTGNLTTDFKGNGNITVLGGHGVDDLTFENGTGTINASGNDGADIIRVGLNTLHTAGIVTINGGAGDDTITVRETSGTNINGGDDNDTMRYVSLAGGAVSFDGADTANGGNGTDVLIIEAGGSTDRQLLTHGAGIIGIETIRHEGTFTGGNDLLLDMSQTGSANVVQLAGGYSDDVRVTNMTNAQTLELVTDIESGATPQLVLGHTASIIQTFNVQFDGGVHVQDIVSTSPAGEIDGYFFNSIGIGENGVHDASHLDSDVGITGTEDFFLGDSFTHAYNVSNGLVSANTANGVFTGDLTVWLDGGHQTAVGGAGNDFIATNDGLFGGDDLINLSAGGNDTVFMANYSGFAFEALTATNFTHVTNWSNDKIQLDSSNLGTIENASGNPTLTVFQQNLGFNETVNATGTGVSYVKLTTTVTGAANADALFDAALGGAQMGVAATTDQILVSAYDNDHSQMVLFTVDTNTTGAGLLSSADNVTAVVGVVAMSAADYAAFSASNLNLVA